MIKWQNANLKILECNFVINKMGKKSWNNIIPVYNFLPYKYHQDQVIYLVWSYKHCLDTKGNLFENCDLCLLLLLWAIPRLQQSKHKLKFIFEKYSSLYLKSIWLNHVDHIPHHDHQLRGMSLCGSKITHWPPKAWASEEYKLKHMSGQNMKASCEQIKTIQ
mgnify:FL=1